MKHRKRKKLIKCQLLLLSFSLLLLNNHLVPNSTAFSDEIESYLYGSFFGGSLEDKITDFEVDQFGCIFAVGGTYSDDLHTTENAFQVEYGGGIQPDVHTDGGDGFLFKTSIEGNISWCSYFGGSGIDYINSIELDFYNNLIICGKTESTDFPVTEDALYPTLNPSGDSDGFIAKFAENGTLIYSSYLGGNQYDELSSANIDNNGDYWFVGTSTSTDLEVTTNTIQSSPGGDADIYIAKFNPLFDNLLLLSYWGGLGADVAYGSEIDNNNNLIITGIVIGENLIVENPLYTDFGGNRDVFVAKFNQTNNLTFSTYFGGNGMDDPFGSAVDNQGNFLFSGRTSSDDYPVHNEYQSEYNGEVDGIYTVIGNDDTVLYSTYLGGNDWDTLHDIDVTDSGKILGCGIGTRGFPLEKSFTSSDITGNKMILMQFSSEYEIEFSTQFGNYNGITPSQVKSYEESMIVVGRIDSTSFHISEDALQAENAGQADGFILKFEIDSYLENLVELEPESTLPVYPAWMLGSSVIGIIFSYFILKNKLQ